MSDDTTSMANAREAFNRGGSLMEAIEIAENGVLYPIWQIGRQQREVLSRIKVGTWIHDSNKDAAYLGQSKFMVSGLGKFMVSGLGVDHAELLVRYRVGVAHLGRDRRISAIQLVELIVSGEVGFREEEKKPERRFRVGDLVRKIRGAEWEGRVVGYYSTDLTPEGYAVESSAHRGSVQIYPAAALEAVRGK